jgi:hypothetical protein
MFGAYQDARGQMYLVNFNRSSTAMYRPGMGQALPSNMYTVTYGDGSTGFLDPSDGTYYDSQGNDVTGYVQNYGGATVTGQATAAQIQAAEGIAPAAPSLLQSITKALAPGPSPRVTVPTTPASTQAMPTIGGISISTLMLGAVGLVLVMSLMNRGGGRR